LNPARRLFEVAGAFLQLGFRQAISYPLRFAAGQVAQIVPVFIFYFVAKHFGDRPALGHGGDYYTFVVVGLIGFRLLDAGIRGLAHDIDTAINRGWLEMFLVEPVRWRFLPVGMSQWPAAQAVVGALAIAAVSLLLGAQYRLEGLPMAVLILALGLVAGLAIATMAASLAVLAKSGEPVLFLYSLVAQVFSGVYFSLEVIPGQLRVLSFLTPHTYVIQALRKVLMPSGAELSGMSAGEGLLGLTLFTVLAYPLSLWIYGRALEYGRKLGVLSGY
jgi:ABC-2 type transport system permease protein